MNRDDRKMLRAIKRAAAIASGNLVGYRMAGKTEKPKKGKGSYRRHEKYKFNGRAD